jgi:hypothetical protein
MVSYSGQLAAHGFWNSKWCAASTAAGSKCARKIYSQIDACLSCFDHVTYGVIACIPAFTRRSCHISSPEPIFHRVLRLACRIFQTMQDKPGQDFDGGEKKWILIWLTSVNRRHRAWVCQDLWSKWNHGLHSFQGPLILTQQGISGALGIYWIILGNYGWDVANLDRNAGIDTMFVMNADRVRTSDWPIDAAVASSTTMKVPNLEKAEDGAAMLRHATWGAVASWSQNIHISCYLMLFWF